MQPIFLWPPALLWRDPWPGVRVDSHLSVMDGLIVIIDILIYAIVSFCFLLFGFWALDRVIVAVSDLFDGR